MLLREKGPVQRKYAANPLPSINNQSTFSQTNEIISKRAAESEEKGNGGREKKSI